MSFNPYEPPTSAYDGNYTNPNAGAVVSDSIIASLRKTRPWVAFLAILGFIGAGLMVLGGLAVATKIPAMGLGYLVGAAIGMIPALAMHRYAKALNKLLHGGGVPELEEAMDAQASFWQILGIFTLIYMALAVVGIGAVMVAGASAFASL
jgi:hypothetical protein